MKWKEAGKCEGTKRNEVGRGDGCVKTRKTNRKIGC